MSRSAIIEHAVNKLFGINPTDKTLAEELHSAGAGLRRARNTESHDGTPLALSDETVLDKPETFVGERLTLHTEQARY